MNAKIGRQHKNELMCEALAYAGELVRQVVQTYEAFNELPDHEREFIDEYIESIGLNLMRQAERRRVG